jgi:two-component system chemotaxis response regulator CheB
LTAAAGGRTKEDAGVFDVVAIGASLGGLEAMRALLRGLSPGFASPIVLVQHRMNDPDGLLVELLAGQSPLPVSEPEVKEPIQKGRVYVAPPDYHLLVERGYFSLSTDEAVCHARPSIDVLFESVACSYGALSIAVVLTGSSRDGADGARAVKTAGGRVFVQDPDTSWSPVAPRAVLSRTRVDGIFDIERMAERLSSLCTPAEPGGSAAPIARAAP